VAVADNTDNDRPTADHLAPEPEVHKPPAAERTAPEVSDLIGWLPDLPVAPEPKRMREVTPGMTDEQVLAHYRDRRRNPYLTLGTARALYALSMKHRPTPRA
jgi:hypothetical protein